MVGVIASHGFMLQPILGIHGDKVTAKTIIKIVMAINTQIMMKIFFCEQKKKQGKLKITLQKNKNKK